jgi:predicted Ser/Thr protein kinase
MDKSFDISTLKLLAQGGQADIYQYDEDKIIRIPRDTNGFKNIEYEYVVYKQLENKVKAPKIYEMVYINNGPAIVMQNISGITMLDQIKSNPLKVLFFTKKLAELQVSIFDTLVDNRIRNGKESAIFCINESKRLSQLEKDKLVDIVNDFPECNNLCHGDFHPGNIIFSNNEYHIIDWSSATRNSCISDVAHSYLLLINTPRLPGISQFEYQKQKIFARIMAKQYYKEVDKHIHINSELFSKYILVKAAERTFYGMDSEQKWLLKYIKSNLN